MLFFGFSIKIKLLFWLFLKQSEQKTFVVYKNSAFYFLVFRLSKGKNSFDKILGSFFWCSNKYRYVFSLFLSSNQNVTTDVIGFTHLCIVRKNKFGLVKEIVIYHDAQNAKQKHCFPPIILLQNNWSVGKNQSSFNS